MQLTGVNINIFIVDNKKKCIQIKDSLRHNITVVAKTSIKIPFDSEMH